MSAARFDDWMSQHMREHESLYGSSRRSGAAEDNLVLLNRGRFGKAGGIG
jgi:hypothetical protein